MKRIYFVMLFAALATIGYAQTDDKVQFKEILGIGLAYNF